MFQRALLTAKLVAQQFGRAGLPWVWRRAKQEWLRPRTGLGRSLHSIRSKFRRKAPVHMSAQLPLSADAGILFAFYDLDLVPVTFDFLWFLLGADMARRQAGLASVHVVIVPGSEEGLRREDDLYEQAVTPAARNARVQNILVAACPLLPTLSGLTLAASREHAGLLVHAAGGAVFPAFYKHDLPRRAEVKEQLDLYRRNGGDVTVLRATESDLAAIDRFFAEHARGRRVVTITLREYSYMTARNSNLNAWAAFAEGLDPARYAVIIVRDTERCFAQPPAELARFTMFDAAAAHLGLRMAVYERAYINLGVNNGPMCLCWLNANVRYITFKILTAGVPQTTIDYMKFLGFEIGCSLPFATSAQKWVWEDDETEIIAREFAAMSQIIDGRS